ncbi:Uncharacterized membrane protein YesL [Domibacillus enclensis]|nr:Uncharacterized membrane protein YesL [Domibacillus enclensis]
MNAIANLFLLSVLWAVFCLPLLTVGPATAATLAVISEWQRKENDSVIRSFFRLFRLHFKQGMLIGNLWILSGILLSVDLFFVLHMQVSWNLIPLFLVTLAMLLWAFLGTAIFPCMIHSAKKGFSLVKLSFTIAFLDIQTTFAVLILWTAAILLFTVSPVLMMASFVPIFYIHLQFFFRSMNLLKSRVSLEMKLLDS